MYSYLLNLTIEASRLIAKLETMVVTFSIRATTVLFTCAIKRNSTSAILGCKLLVAVFNPPPPTHHPSFSRHWFRRTSQSRVFVCALLLHRSNVEAPRVPACRERGQMPVKWPALQSLAQTRTGFQLDDTAHALAMTSNTVNSFSQQALALQVTSKG